MAFPSLSLATLLIAIVLGGIMLSILIHLGARAIAPHAAPYADKGWELHCRACGWKQDALKVGIVRIGAVSRGKRILGRCGGCGKWGWLALERTGPH